MEVRLHRLLRPGKKAYLIGIGGAGMSGLAKLLAAHELEVTGSDIKESRSTDQLRAQGIGVVIGHESNALDSADFAVYSSAIKKENAEYQRAERLQIPLYHRADVLSFLTNQGISIGVIGTHGKTTCTALASFLLTEAGFNPTCLAGGQIANYGSNILIGNRRFFVAEIDESDKSHLNFCPDFSLILNLEEEHLDVYRDLADAKQSFRRFIDMGKLAGKIVYCLDDPNLQDIIKGSSVETISFGRAANADFQARRIRLEGFRSHFLLFEKGREVGEARLNVPGVHNVVNAVGVIALLRSVGLEYDKMLSLIPLFRGVGRRLEVKLHTQDLMIIDDYAHHPTEVRVSLEALKSLERKITCVFQPHRFSRTARLAEGFVHAFAAADRVIFTDIYGAGEPNPEGIQVGLIYDLVKEGGHPDVRVVAKRELVDFLVAHRRKEEIITFLGAGDIGEIADEFANRFESAYSH